MSEKLLNRREVKASQYENTEMYQATRYLTDLGIFSRMDQTELYHGRAGDGSDWRVEASIDNSDNNTGNRNVNKIPALSTSNYDTARDFATARAHKDQTAEIYQIISDDKDAVIIDGTFNWWSLDEAGRNGAKEAIKMTLPSITSGSPLDFEDRRALDHLTPRDLNINPNGLIYDDNFAPLAQRLGLRQSVMDKIGAAKNTRTLLYSYPEFTMNKVLSAFMNNKPYIDIKTTDNNGYHRVPISHEYLANWFRNIHAVGYKNLYWSATLGHNIENNLLFDLEKVNTTDEMERRNKEMHRRFGSFSLIAANKNLSNTSELASSLTNNLYIKPHEIIELAKKTPGFKEILESDAGNWEKYTLEEHTETVLKLFDDNYADLLPASSLPIMRLALLSHDLGKSEAARRHDKANQRQYNTAAAEMFLRENSIDESTRKLIITMIGDGMDYTKRWMIDRDKTISKEFYNFCEKTMKEYLGREKVDKGTVLGFRNMLEVLQTCDSAAYTTMAVTKSKNTSYRNYGSFDDRFESFHGFTGHRARIKN